MISANLEDCYLLMKCSLELPISIVNFGINSRDLSQLQDLCFVSNSPLPTLLDLMVCFLSLSIPVPFTFYIFRYKNYIKKIRINTIK